MWKRSGWHILINAWTSGKTERSAINACRILVCAIVGTAQLTCL